MVSCFRLNKTNNRRAGEVAKDIAIDARGHAFDSLVGQISHSGANGSPPLRCFLEAVLLMR